MSYRVCLAAALCLGGALTSGCDLASQGYAPVQQLRATPDWEDTARQVLHLTRASNLWDPEAIATAIGVPLRPRYSWLGCPDCGRRTSVPRDDYAVPQMAAPVGSEFRYSRFFEDGRRTTIAGFSLSFRLSEAAPCDFVSRMERAFRSEHGTVVVQDVPSDRLERALPVVDGVTAHRSGGRVVAVFGIGQGGKICRIVVQIEEGAALVPANWARDPIQ